MRLGLIGLDTSHVEVFATLFNESGHPDHLPGMRITTAFPGGSPDFALSRDRVEKFTDLMRGRHGIEIVGSPRSVAEAVDAVLLTSVDGRVHLAQFAEISEYRRPVFIDKPLAVTSADARKIVALAQRHATPLFTASSLRFATDFRLALAEADSGRIFGADFAGPMTFEPTQPGYFWYGIHLAEMLFASLGTGCSSVQARESGDCEWILGLWSDGRFGNLRGNRRGNGLFNGILHRERGNRWVNAPAGLPAYRELAKEIQRFFQGAPAPVTPAESVEVIRFLEAANESRARGGAEIVL